MRLIFFLVFSLWTVSSLAYNIVVVDEMNDQTMKQIIRRIQLYSEGSEFLYLAEAHKEEKIQALQTAIAENSVNRFDCISFEAQDSQPAFNYLNRFNLEAESWKALFRTYWRYYYGVMNARGWKDYLYSDESADLQSEWYWKFHQKGLRVSGHEAPMEEFFEMIWDLKMNHPGDVLKDYEVHSLLRNRFHAEGISANFQANQCKGMIVIGGAFHFLTFDELIVAAQKEGLEHLDQKMSRSDGIQEQVAAKTGKKYALINLRTYSDDQELQDLLENYLLKDAALNVLIKR